MNKRIILCGIVGVMAVAVTWLLLGETSPLTTRFRPNEVPFSEAWRGLHPHIGFLVYVMNARFSQDGYVESSILVFLQWFTITFVIGKLFSRQPTGETY